MSLGMLELWVTLGQEQSNSSSESRILTAPSVAEAGSKVLGVWEPSAPPVTCASCGTKCCVLSPGLEGKGQLQPSACPRLIPFDISWLAAVKLRC